MKDHVLLAVIGGVVALLAIVFALKNCGDPRSSFEPLEELTLEANLVTPLPPAGPTTGALNPGVQRSRSLAVYLDTSHPMGGFLAPSSAVGESKLRAVVQQIPDQLIRVYRTEAAVRWAVVDTQVTQVTTEPHFVASTFRGSDTHLDLALDEILEDLSTGRIEVAALVTDLVATRNVDGALGISSGLRTWLQSPQVRSGAFDLGLLGFRLAYWGVTTSSERGCPQRRGDLGCWFSERAGRYVPMTEVVERPVYVLLLGRTGEGDGRIAAADSYLQKVGKFMVQELKKMDVEARWELLSDWTRPKPGRLSCHASIDGQPQKALWRDTAGSYKCLQNQEVTLDCSWLDINEVATRGAAPRGATSTSLKWKEIVLSWPEVDISRLPDASMRLAIDCTELREHPPQEDLRFEILSAQLPQATQLWQDWSSSTDEFESFLNQTLQLALFVETLEPPEYRVELKQPLLRAGS